MIKLPLREYVLMQRESINGTGKASARPFFCFPFEHVVHKGPPGNMRPLVMEKKIRIAGTGGSKPEEMFCIFRSSLIARRGYILKS